MFSEIDYQHILDCIPVSETNNDTWVRVGMALKHEGQPFEMFDEWSSKDPRPNQYRGTEYTLRRWDSFQGGSGTPVTGATLTEMARSYGYEPFPKKTTEFFDWNDEITSNGEEVSDNPSQDMMGWDWEIACDGEWTPSKVKKFHCPSSIQPSKKPPFQIIEYLEACFNPDDHVNVLTSSYFDEGGKYQPYGLGVMTNSRDDHIRNLRRAAEKSDFFDEVFGSYDHEAGVWIRVNPTIGWPREGQKGLADRDVVRFDNALIECDVLSLEDQLEKIKELNLPYKALVYSGGKSIHAIVRVDAKNSADYKDRVDWLHEYCKSNGFPIDEQNKNPSRLTRIPGVERGDQKQFLIETAKPEPFDDFKKRAIAEQEAAKIELMDISKILEQPLPLAPELIEGIVRCGHKMLISGPSKAGKSFALIALAIGIAEGKTWFGHQCKKGKVLYINLEIDPASFGDRVQRVYTALGWEPNHASNIRVWNLRGQSKPLDLLTPLLEALLKKNDFDLVIIDPIYKVITGDENNASDMGKFCNLFDRIARAGGCTVAYCHHHSKGSQAHKVAIDRASGSGVFGRDPDAIIDMTEIGLSEEERSELKARLMAKVDDAYLKASGQWENLARVHPEDLNNRLAKGLAVQEHLKLYPEKRETYEKRVAQADALGDCSAYRISYTLREFKSPNEQNLFFKYPIHVSDPSDFLKELYLVGDNSLEKLMNRKEKADRKRDDKKREWYEDERRKGEMVSISRFAKELDCGESTIRRWVDKQDDLKRGNGWIVWTDEEIPKESPKERAKATREEASQEKSQTLQESS